MIIILLFLIADISLLVLSIYFVIKSKWLFLILTIIGLYLFIKWTLLFLYNYSSWRRSNIFWKMVKKQPEEFYDVFKERDNIWQILESESAKMIFDKLEKNKDEWIGPFILHRPSTGKNIYIYGKDGLYQEEQDKIIRAINKHNK